METEDGITDNAQDVVNASEDMVDDSNDAMRAYQPKWYDTGVYLVEGLKDGIKDMAQEVIDEVVQMVEDSVAAAQEAADIHSPSRKTRYIGQMMGKGAALGLIDTKAVVEDAAERTITGPLDRFADMKYRPESRSSQPTEMTVNINIAEIRSDMDIERLTDKMARQIQRKLNKVQNHATWVGGM